jgi:hypothetical protein
MQGCLQGMQHGHDSAGRAHDTRRDLVDEYPNAANLSAIDDLRKIFRRASVREE